MRHRYLFTLRPGWVVLHVITLALAVTMVLLGRWQLHVSEHKHFSIQNFGYALQWWLFAAAAVFFWWTVLRRAALEQRERDQEPGAGPPSLVAPRRTT